MATGVSFQIPHSLQKIRKWIGTINFKREDGKRNAIVAQDVLSRIALAVIEMEINMQGDVKRALRGLESQRDAALKAQAAAEAKLVKASAAVNAAQTAQAQAEKDAQALRDQIDAQAPFLINQEDQTELTAVLATLPPDDTGGDVPPPVAADTTPGGALIDTVTGGIAG